MEGAYQSKRTGSAPVTGAAVRLAVLTRWPAAANRAAVRLPVVLDNRRLALALEESGSGSPYQAEHYERWHGLLRGVLDRIPGMSGSDFTAHALLAATRADLVEHLAGQERVSREAMRARLADFTARVLDSGPPRPGDEG